jgi:hypothetical protein
VPHSTAGRGARNQNPGALSLSIVTILTELSQLSLIAEEF